MGTERGAMVRFVGLLLCLGFTLSTAFYLPGVMPHDYKEGEKVKVRVNRLDSVRTQLPFDYYSLPFCQPEELRQHQEEMDSFSEKIKDEYRAHWVVDNLPAAYRLNLYTVDPDAPPEQQYSYERGFLIGFVGGDLTYLSHQAQRNAQSGVPYINNHLRLVFKYHNHENPETHEITGARIVGFEVYHASVKHTYTGSKFNQERSNPLTSCTPLNPIWKPHNLYPDQMML